MAKTTAISLAATLCRKFPDTASLTLARRLYKENIERFPTLDAARSAIRAVRGAAGRNNAGTIVAPEHRVPWEKRQAGWVKECPPSFSEDWAPVELDTPCRVLSLSDLHIPYHDKQAIESAVKYGKKRHTPDAIVLNGDIGDFYRVSRWEKDPKARSFKDEVDTTKEFLSWIRGQFREARIIYKLGNHDEWWDKFIWQKAPEIFDLDNVQLHNILEFEQFGIERVDDNPIMAGKLPILHGHEAGKGMTSPVNPARGMFLRTLHQCLSGHLHRTSTHCEPDMFKREITTWSQGCLCSRNPRYARFNKWNLGFAAVETEADGTYNLFNYRLSNDHEVRTA